MSPVRAPRLPRVLRRTVVAVAVVLTVLTVALTVAMFVDDASIEGSRVETVATVLAVSPLRTGIEFVDVTGITIRPAGGVLYPGNLQVGQQFKVEYAANDPSLVRVAGRSAENVLVSVGLMLVITWLVAALLITCATRWHPSVGRSAPRSSSGAARVVG
ncbi:MAG: DUF3592 domain-containing protein [Nakamurella sp.]